MQDRLDNVTVVLPAERLAAIGVAILTAAGMQPPDAATVVAALLSAELRETRSHGFIRLPYLVARLRDGGADPLARPTVVRQTGATAVVDGQRALGPVTAAFATGLAVEMATQTGVGVVSVRNSDFFGTCAHPAILATEHGMIGLVWTNGNPGMAPYGGARNAIGNNPLGIAVPRRDGRPLVLDMAMSVSAGGRIRLHAEHGLPIPDDWALDSEGNATIDPHDFLNGGALQPLGHKGYGLAVMGEVLAGLLGGARMLSEIPAWFKATDKPVGSGHLHIALDIKAFGDPDEFSARVEEMAAELKNAPLRPGIREILLPGERAGRAETGQSRNGVTLEAEIAGRLRALGTELNIEEGLLAPLSIAKGHS